MQRFSRIARQRVAILAAVLFCTVIATGQSAQAQLKPVSTWDLGGVKLGMTPSQVQSVLGARGFTQSTPDMVQCSSEQARHERTGKAQPLKCIQYISADSPKASMRIGFTEDFPHHPDVMRVFSIKFSPKSPTKEFSEADGRAFLAQLNQKYGKDTATMGEAAQWCPAGALFPMGPCSGPSVRFDWANFNVYLENTDLDHRSADAIRAYVANQRHDIKPEF